MPALLPPTPARLRQPHQPGHLTTLPGPWAHTPAARRALLAPYFVRADDDPPEAKSPTVAHRAVARLVRRGSVRVVLTTNFDRLLERALDDLDVPYQVISRPEALAGAEPLTHATATVVKLHGDWQDLDQLNTTAELTAYDHWWDDYLDRLLPDHGLIAVGWSADSDRALVQAIERTSPRRYPAYYVARGSLREAAQRLVATRGMHIVVAESADAFSTNLLAKLEALDRMQEQPLTRALAVAQLKLALPDPVRRIDLHDLVHNETSRVVELLNDQGRYSYDSPRPYAELGERLDRYTADVATLCALVAVGVYHGGPEHDQLWLDVMQRVLSSVGRARIGFPVLIRAHRFPALLIAAAGGVAAVAARREAFLATLLLQPTLPGLTPPDDDKRLVEALLPDEVLDDTTANKLVRSEDEMRWYFPVERMFRPAVRLATHEIILDNERYGEVFDRYGYLRSLIEADQLNRASLGEWIGRYGMSPAAMQAASEAAAVAKGTRATWDVLDGGAFTDDPQRRVAAAIARLREQAKSAGVTYDG